MKDILDWLNNMSAIIFETDNHKNILTFQKTDKQLLIVLSIVDSKGRANSRNIFLDENQIKELKKFFNKIPEVSL